jgi:hypothetical protein
MIRGDGGASKDSHARKVAGGPRVWSEECGVKGVE